MSSFFEFNGVKSSDMGLTVERFRPLYSARKRVTAHRIPGRIGDLHECDGSFENYPISYQCWFKKPDQYDQMAWQAHRILEWLSSAPMGAKLRDSYDNRVYHLASYIGGAEIENVRNAYGRFTVTFDCDPRAFVQSGDYEITKGNPGVLINPTAYASTPLIELTGSIGGSIKIGAGIITVVFPDMATHTVRIDCDIKEAWEIVDGEEIPTNAFVATRDFPKLYPDANNVELVGGITSAIIDPRWWTL